MEISLGSFKKFNTDENVIISKIIRNLGDEFLLEPILDIGAGSGDISSSSLSNKITFLLDIDPPKTKNLNKKHQWIIGDFLGYDFGSLPQFNTLIFSHSLQYLDDDSEKLLRKISEINAKFILEVSNEILGEYKKLLEFTLKNYKISNPETGIDYFHPLYEKACKIPFKGQIYSSNFDDLSEILLFHIMDADLRYCKRKMTDFLQNLLPEPCITINQNLKVWKKNEN